MRNQASLICLKVLILARIQAVLRQILQVTLVPLRPTQIQVTPVASKTQIKALKMIERNLLKNQATVTVKMIQCIQEEVVLVNLKLQVNQIVHRMNLPIKVSLNL